MTSLIQFVLSLDPMVSNSYEQDKYYHLYIEWWICNLAGVVCLRSTCMHKNQEGFLKWEKLKCNPPSMSLKTDLNHHGPNPSWNHSHSFWASRPKQLVKSM